MIALHVDSSRLHLCNWKDDEQIEAVRNAVRCRHWSKSLSVALAHCSLREYVKTMLLEFLSVLGAGTSAQPPDHEDD